MGLWVGSNPSVQEAPSTGEQEMAIAERIARRDIMPRVPRWARYAVMPPMAMESRRAGGKV